MLILLRGAAEVAICTRIARPARPWSRFAVPIADALRVGHRAYAMPTRAVQSLRYALNVTDLSDAMSEPIRLSKRMSELGLASRREADEWIERGWVHVNRAVAVLGQKVIPSDRIEVMRQASAEQAERVTVLINKPIGYVSGQAEDGYEPAVVLVRPEHRWNGDRSSRRFAREQLKNLVPAGRLDIDSTGLLVLTQDGRIAKHLIGEDSSVEKEYLVRVEPTNALPRGVLPDHELARLNHGLSLDGQALKPAKVWWQNDDQLRFVLNEGKKRQIRRMCEAVGLRVIALKRIRIGNVTLGDLPIGKWRYLGANERF